MSLDMLWSLKWFNPHLFSLNKLGFSLSIAFCWAWKCFEAWSDLKLEHASTAGFLSLWTSSLYQAELVSLYAGAEENMLVCGFTSWWQSTIWPNKVEPCGNVETGWSPKSLVLLIFPANLFLSLSSPVVSKFQLRCWTIHGTCQLDSNCKCWVCVNYGNAEVSSVISE